MSLPLPRPRRPARVVAPVSLAVAVTAIGCELACVGVALTLDPGAPAWLVAALYVGCLTFCAVAVGTLRRAVSGRPRSARHHGVLITYAGAHRAARAATTERSTT